MGHVYADIELINGNDLGMAMKQLIGDDEVKRISVNMLVDTGALMLCINENIQSYLQLPVMEQRKAWLANGVMVEYDVVGFVEVRFKNRATSCRAMVLPGDSEPLLGAIPLEDMDVIVDPLHGKLIVHPDHPFLAQVRLK